MCQICEQNKQRIALMEQNYTPAKVTIDLEEYLKLKERAKGNTAESQQEVLRKVEVALTDFLKKMTLKSFYDSPSQALIESFTDAKLQVFRERVDSPVRIVNR